MHTKEMPAHDRRENRSVRQEKLGQACETSPAKNLADREPDCRSKAHRPGKKHQVRFEFNQAKAQKTARETAFTLEASAAAHVFVAGTFNDWSPTASPLQNRGNGTWSASLSLPSGTYEYRFVVDGQWQDDPAAAQYTINPFGTMNAVLTVQ